jgi:AcrR family transcriptional regulator
MDRRVRRTRRNMRNAIIELVLERGYDTITIQDITDRADVSRATFYLHYKDKDELLTDSLDRIFKEFIETLDSPLDGLDMAGIVLQAGKVAFQYVADNHVLYRSLLLSEYGVPYAIYNEIRYIAKAIHKQFETLHTQGHVGNLQDDLALELAANHAAGALFSLIIWWLENDMPQQPDAMAQRFHDMVMAGILCESNASPA